MKNGLLSLLWALVLGVNQTAALLPHTLALEEGEEPPADEPGGSFVFSEEEPETEIIAEPEPENSTEPEVIPEETTVLEEPSGQEPSEPASPEEPAETEPVVDTELISYTLSEDLQAVELFGEAAVSEEAAFSVLQSELSLDYKQAEELTQELFAVRDAGEVPEYPRSGDGSNIESISVRWLTPDTVDNGDDALLYVRPSGDNLFDVRLQINYALSGEHNYNPGDITITIPASIIHKRGGGYAGITVLPYPEDPSTKNDFNWKLVGDQYIITNTKRMSAATKGYIQIAFDELRPHEIVDMDDSDLFNAYIEVVTHKGNTIALRSEDISAQIDTEAQVTSAGKRAYQAVERVPASAIPESQRIEGEEEYIRVGWYVWGDTVSNTMYTLDLLDTIPLEYNGFIVNADSEDGLSSYRQNVYRGYSQGQTSYYYFTTAYPASQFEKDTEYTFHNNIEFILTEVDPEANGDPQLVTHAYASASTSWSYTDPQWYDPSGHFMVTKNGNDDTPRNNLTHYRTYTYGVSDSHIWATKTPIHGWYGIYPSALNELQDQYEEYGTEGGVRLSYTIDNVGYVMPWMFDSSSFAEDGELASRICSNYRRPVRIVTEDSGVRIGRYGPLLVLGTDYDLVELEIPDTVYLYTGKPQNINPDGSWAAMNAGDGTFNYTRDNDKSHNPDIHVEILRNGAWEDYAVVSWPGGTYTVAYADGRTQTSKVIPLPEGTENFRTTVTLQNDNEETALQAAIDFDVRVVIKLKSTQEVISMIEEAFAKSNTPEIFVYNSAVMKAERADEESGIVEIERDGYDSLRGYTTDTMVYPYKDAQQRMSETDYENRRIILHYSAKVEERSVINDRVTYDQAITDGRLDVQRHGFWHDLLPKGVIPDLGTIKLRENDTVVDAYTIENYRGSGRTMLVVEAELTPSPVRYRSGDMYYYEDVPSITFDAYYDFDSYVDYGNAIHNVIAFESTNEFMGTVEHYTAEFDDTSTSNNIATERAFEGDEKELMNDLNPDRESPVVYAGTTTVIDLLSAARTSLMKDVMVNNDGLWSKGTWDEKEGDDEYNERARSDNERVVYEGGQYSYRLRMVSDDATISKDLILYDSLENFYAADGNASIDIDAPRWQGYFRGVDVNQLMENGCAPVVYYSTITGLELSDESDPDRANTVNVDLTNREVWIPAEEYTGSLDDVRAVAVDASKRADGTDFELQPLESAMIMIRMQAPSGDAARQYIEQDAHAYNNSYLLCTQVDVETLESDSDNFVREDYTKVGLMEYNHPVEKSWRDDNDRDGIRPDSVTVHLLANGEDTGKTLVLTAEENWSGVFEHIPYSDPVGEKIRYTVREDEAEGYTQLTQFTVDGTVIINTHEPEKISLPGEKTWVGDTAETRPESVRIELYANDVYQKYMTVSADKDGNWNYTFSDLFKYENGEEIVYTVKEEVVTSGKAASYSAETDGLNIINTYHPKGDLTVSKTVVNTTEVSAEQEFTFTFTFSKHVVVDVPVFDEFEYDVLDEYGEVIEGLSGTVANNGTVTIKGGQTIHVKEIDEYLDYTVTEEQTAGFVRTFVKGDSGTIVPNQTAEAQFTNTYAASGQFNVPARKTLYNAELKRYQFRFELYEVTENEDGSETETLIRTTSNARADEVNYREDGTLESSAGDAVFGVLRFNEADHGKTYHYRVKEVDTEKPGYTYDSEPADVYLTITDNGDGTLTITPAYEKNGEEEETAVFENTYNAEGEIVLRAWKDLQGRRLQDDEFTFELLDEEGNPIQEKKNSADGSVVFDALKYTQDDIGKTYIYSVREVKGEDSTVNYSEDVFGYSVEVLDNGDGTLSFNQGFAEPIYGVPECDMCHGENNRVDHLVGDLNTINAQYPDFPAYYNNLVTEMVKAGVTPPSGPGTITCDGNYAGVLSAFNDLMAYVGASERAEAHHTVYLKTEADTSGTPSFTLGYYCTECKGGGNSICPVCGGTGILPTTITDGTPFSYYNTGGNYIYSSPYDTYEDFAAAYPQYRSIQVYKRICDLGGDLTIGNDQPRSWYISQYMHWRNQYDALGLPHTMDTRVPHAEYTGVDTELARLFGIPEDSNTTYSVDMLSGVGFAHGSGNVAYVIQASCGLEVECPECDGKGALETIIGWNTEEGELPVFVNTLKPGSLSVSKYVTNAENADPNQEFRFKVKLIGEGIEDGTKEYTLSVLDSGTPDNSSDPAPDAPNTDSVPLLQADGSGLREADIIASGTYAVWGISWRITSDGELILGNGAEQNFDTTDHPYSPVTDSAVYSPWCSATGGYGKLVKSIRVDGTVHCSGSFQMMFNGNDFPNLESVDFTGMDFNGVTNLNYMLAAASKLKTVTFGNTSTGTRATMYYMLHTCYSLEELDLSGFDAGNLTSGGMSNMFYQVSRLNRVHLSSSFSFKDVQLNTPPENDTYTGKWISEDGVYGPYTPAELRNNYTSAMAGTWVWQEQPKEYTVRFTAEEGAGGSMAPEIYEIAEEGVLPRNRFIWNGYNFDHWTVESVNGAAPAEETMYSDQDTIPADTYQAKDIVVLKAVFTPVDTTVNIQNGEFEFTLKGDEKATFDDFPAGTAYQVYEETPDGWVLVDMRNVSGTIEPVQTAAAVFVNDYQPGTTTAQFFGTKTLDGMAAEDGAYQFILEESGNETGKLLILGDDGEQTEQTLPITVSNKAGGLIQFPIILYGPDDVGTHTYTVSEADPEDSRIDYDTHTETVRVVVTDNGDGTLSSTVAYESGWISFANRTRPGELRIRKVGNNVTDANADDEFTFKITLNNSKGLPLGSDDEISWYTLDKDGNMIIPETEELENPDEDDSGKTTGVLPDQVRTLAAVDAAQNIAAALRNNPMITPAGLFTAPVLKEVPAAYHPLETDEDEGEVTIIASGTKDDVDWRITSEGELIIGNGGTQTFRNVREERWDYSHGSVKIKTDRGWQDAYDPYEDEWGKKRDISGDYAWYPYREQITSVRFDGTVNGNGSMASMFYGFKNCTSIDLTGFTTGNVTNMQYMFQGCSSLTSLDLSGFNTSKVKNMYAMFNGCSKLTELDLSGFDTSQVQDMGGMFGNCTSLKKLDLRTFSTARLNGNDGMGSYQSVDGYTSSGTVAGLLSGCSSLEWMYLGSGLKMTYYTGRGHYLRTCGLPSNNYEQWVKEDRTDGPYSGNELCTNYVSARAGIWVKEIKDDYAVVKYNSNGGSLYSTSVKYVSRTDENQSVTLPNSVYKLHYDFTGWNTEPDGSGTHYEPGQEFMQITDLVDFGDSITLYAELVPSKQRNYRVEHWQEGADFGWYYRKETEYLKGDYTVPVTPAVKEYDGFRLPEAQTVTIAEDDSTVVQYYYDRCRYYVAFDGNGATSGQMKTMMLSFVNPDTLPMNVFQKTGAIFTGWNTEPDGSGTAYSNNQRIYQLTDVDEETIVLYAQWQEIPNEELTPTNGVIYVKCKAGETIVLPGLSDGTTYTIEEVDVPAGWTQESTDNITGTITANQTNQESVTNTYAAEGEVVLEVHKTLENGSPAEGQFTFVLTDPYGRVLQTKTNGEVDLTERYYDPDQGAAVDNPWYNTAPVVFDPVSVDRPGTQVFYIREVPGNDSAVEYDDRVITAVVQTTDVGGGHLESTVTYTDTPLFTNAMKDTSLKISKTTVDSPSEDEEFTFTVTLTDASGNALSGSYPAKKYTQDYEVVQEETEVTKYSHTPNVDDDGNAHGNYPDDLYQVDDVTIDGAETVHVSLEYDIEYSYDGLSVYGGNASAPDQMTRLGYYEGSGQTEFDVAGDTVRFDFYSDYSAAYYGYYAVITGTGIGDVEHGTEELELSSGDTFTLKDGEYVVIGGLPNGTSYTVTEEPKDNWELTETAGDTGTLKSGGTGEASFTNTYEQPPVDMTAVIKAEKKVFGGVIEEEDAFLFELQSDGGEVLQVKTTDETGTARSTITFDTMEYTESDIGNVYTYYIQERSGDDENIVFDRMLYKVEVTVSAAGASVVYKTITASDDSEDGFEETEVEGLPVFTNEKLDEDTMIVEVSKAWKNPDGTTKAPNGVAVTFTLYADGEQTEYAVTLDGEEDEASDEAGGYETEAWTATFIGLPKYRTNEEGEEIPIDYTVKETGSFQDYKPDKEEVSDGGTITNELRTYDFSVVLRAKKTVTGGTITTADNFRFTLESEDGSVLQTNTTDTAGKADSLITFDELKYGEVDIGKTYTYYIREVKGSDGKIEYDTRVYKVEVTITEDGTETVYKEVTDSGETEVRIPQFENKKKPTPPGEEPPKPTPPAGTTPNTGDNAKTGLYRVMAGTSFTLMILCLFLLLKDRKQSKRS